MSIGTVQDQGAAGLTRELDGILLFTAAERVQTEEIVSEMLVQFAELVRDEDGRAYVARAYGAPIPNETLWEGWIEFIPVTGVDGEPAPDGDADGPVIASGRETTQPNRTDTEYWATGLTPVYLEGALQRARHPLATGESIRPGAARLPPSSGRGGRRTRTVA
jgi:hypothetical protein